MYQCYFAGTGSYLPEKRMTNAELEEIVDTSDEWIRQRTGISERRVAAADQSTSDLATEASRAAISIASEIFRVCSGSAVA